MAFNEQEKQIILYGKANGKTQEEVTQAIGRLRSGMPVADTSSQPAAQPDSQPGLLSRIGTDIQNRGNQNASILDASNKQADTSISHNVAVGTKLAANTAGGITDTIGELIKSVPGGKEALDAIGGITSAGYKAVVDKLASTQLFQDAAQNPAATKTLEDYLSTGASLGDIANNILAADGVKTGAQKTVDVASNLGSKTASMVSDTVSNTADTAKQLGSDLKNKIQLTTAAKNVDPQLKASADRLFLDGTKTVGDPIKQYDKYLAQSQKAITDIKADPAIAQVGSDIGDAFSKVIKQRKAVGATLGNELKTVGKNKVPIIEPKTSLLSELKDSGLSYNPKTKQLNAFSGTKFAPEEVSMLSDFLKGVQSLGDTPTVNAIDNFISKTRSTLDFTKGKAGIVGTTNAERIINGTVAKLRDSLNPANNGIQALSKYWQANQTYSELSSFIEEGSKYLGKITQSGDFAKDSSLAKSAVQSVLNNGKKDWLITLDSMTGTNLLDKAVLALQAMKDAGDFRGLSLLEELSKGVPTSQSGFIQKIIDFGLTQAGKAVTGTPAEQTRAFLSSLKAGAKQTALPKTK